MNNDAQAKNFKTTGFIFLVITWVILTYLCYHRIIAFETTTLGGAMLLSFILLSSILSVIQLLKMVYDRTYSALVEEND
jgi:hypothetical protein